MKKNTQCCAIGALFLSMLLFASCGARTPSTPSAALLTFYSAIKAQDGEKAWSLLSTASRKSYDAAVFAKVRGELNKLTPEMRQKFTVPGTDTTADKVLLMSAEQYFCTHLKKSPVNKKLASLDLRKVPVEKETITGDTAKVTIKELGEYPMVREEGAWKVDLKE
jgi:hypothetical protein